MIIEKRFITFLLVIVMVMALWLPANVYADTAGETFDRNPQGTDYKNLQIEIDSIEQKFISIDGQTYSVNDGCSFLHQGSLYVWDSEAGTWSNTTDAMSYIIISKEWLSRILTDNGEKEIQISTDGTSWQTIVILNVIDTRSPSITADTNIVMSQDESKTIDLNITGEPAPEITTKDMPGWVSLNGSNQLLFNSGSVAPGTYTFTIDATNEYGSDSIEFNVTIEGKEVKDTTPAALYTTSDAINTTPAATTTNSEVKGDTESQKVLGENAKTSDVADMASYIIASILAALGAFLAIRWNKSALK